MLSRFTLFLLCAICCAASLKAQEVRSVETQDRLQASVLNILGLPVSVTYDVQNYAITYTTTDLNGDSTIASGLLSVPVNVAPDLSFPLAVYNHGTANGDRNATVSRPNVQERLLPVVIAASGYVTASPDYLGFGDNPGRHPYVHAATEASAGRDMIIAVKKYLADRPDGLPNTNDQLFLTGYSQGGHATAALHRDIETNPGDDGLDVTSATYLSGPYSISEVMVGTIFQDGNATLPGYIAYTYISYNLVYGLFDSLEQAFVPPYLEPIRQFADQEITLDSFNAVLDTLLQNNDARFSAIFQDSIREILRSGDPTHPINIALADNDTYDWAPEDPTLIYYCTQDEQVPFRNAILADSVMRANGSTTITLTNGGPLTHGGCVIPAMAETLRFWADQSSITSLGDPVARPDVRLFPNPVFAGQTLRLRGLPGAPLPYLLYDVTGRLAASGLTEAGGQLSLPTGLRSGAYMLRLGIADGTSVVRRLIVR